MNVLKKFIVVVALVAAQSVLAANSRLNDAVTISNLSEVQKILKQEKDLTKNDIQSAINVSDSLFNKANSTRAKSDIQKKQIEVQPKIRIELKKRM